VDHQRPVAEERAQARQSRGEVVRVGCLEGIRGNVAVLA
jgi:hypothetical protein